MKALEHRKLRIGITCYPTLGGSGVVATELGKLLAEQGHQVHFITSSIPFRLGKYNPNIHFHEVEVSQYSVFQYPPYDIALASRMAQVANREKLDILHVHYAVPHAVCAILAKKMINHPIKIITTLHGTDITVMGYDESLKDIIKLGIEESDIVTAVSDELIKQTQTVLNIKKPIHRVYNFVDERIYYKRESKGLRTQFAPYGEKLIVHISNFRPVKRTLDVAKIFAEISKKVTAKLILIGEGPDFAKVCGWLKLNSLHEQTIYLGKQDAVAEILSQMDLLLLPSEQESFGLVALEAMACGVPVIATNAGGLPEVIDHGINGFTFPVGYINDMAEAAINLLLDEEKYQRFSEASIAKARSKFSAQDILQQYLQLYCSSTNE